MSEEKQFTVDQGHRFFGVEFNNRIFTLYEKSELTNSEKEEIIASAHASLLHWKSYSGHQLVNTQRALYMIAKAYIAVEDKLKAEEYANKCLNFTRQHEGELKDFDIAYCYEILARASALNHNKSDFKTYYERAIELASKVSNAEDKKWVEKDLKGGRWFDML